MKLVIQIPCFNEEGTLKTTLDALPAHICGIDEIEVLVINDGSSDRSEETALEEGAKVISFKRNLGLARAFEAGLKTSLAMGADIIVNLDADNQYCADDIEKLIEPVLLKKADIAIGTRPIENIKHFSPVKKYSRKWGHL